MTIMPVRLLLVFLAVCSICAGRYGIIHESFQASRTGSSELSQSKHEPLRALEFPTETNGTKKRWPRRLKSKLRVGLRFLNKLNKSRNRKLSPEQRLNIQRNWKKNQEQVDSLYEDSKELSAIKLEIDEELSKLYWERIFEPTGTTLLLENVFKVLKKINKRLVVLKQIKLLELGEFDTPKSNSNLIALASPQVTHTGSRQGDLLDFSKLPNKVIEIVTQKTWVAYANSLVQNLKQLNSHLLPRGALLTQECTFQLWWKFGLKMMDFLFKNAFIDQDAVRSFFDQQPGVIRLIVCHIDFLYQNQFQKSIINQTTDLTENWYWELAHESFKAMSEKQRIIVNGHVWLEYRYLNLYDHSVRNPPHPNFSSCTMFLHSLNHMAYIEALMSLHGSGDPPISHPQPSEIIEMLNQDVQTMISLIAGAMDEQRNERPIIIYLCQVLNFIDRFISPGIIEREFQTHQNFDRFDNVFNTILNLSKMKDIFLMANDYLSFIKEKDPTTWSTSQLYREKILGYVNQAIQVRDHQEAEISRVVNKPSSSNRNVVAEIFPQFLEINASLQENIAALNRALNTFSSS